jgi:hypothetical protein
MLSPASWAAPITGENVMTGRELTVSSHVARKEKAIIQAVRSARTKPEGML